MRGVARGSLLATLLLSWAMPAAADLVPGPPKACPAGGMPATGHGGPFCRLTECKTAQDCLDLAYSIYPKPDLSQFRCVDDVGVCVETRGGTSIRGPYTYEAVGGTCKTQADCKPSEPCRVARRCVYEPKQKPPPAPPPSATVIRKPPSAGSTASVEVRDTERVVPTPKEGCGGCASTGTSGVDGWWVVLALLGVRRGRRARHPTRRNARI